MPVHGELPISQGQQGAAPAPAPPLVDPKPAPQPQQPPPAVVLPKGITLNATTPTGLVTFAREALSDYHVLTAVLIVALSLALFAAVLRFVVGRAFRLKN